LQHIKQHYTELTLSKGITSESDIDVFVNENWITKEMYQAVHSNGYPIPFITEHKSHIQKAYYYFKKHIDFKACANNLRSALESHFREDFFPYTYLINKEGNPLKGKDMPLGMLLDKAKIYYDEVGFNKKPLVKLERFILRSLNPQSHYNPKSNFYRKELEDIFKIYQELKSISNKPLIDIKDYLVFKIKTKDSIKYLYTIELLDHIRIYDKNDGNIPDLSGADKRNYGLISFKKDNEKTKKMSLATTVSNRTLSELYLYTCYTIKTKMNKEPVIETNILNIYTNLKGQSIQDLIDAYNIKK
tara:strand:+ start:661 stop:1566 length:906 start_codon:yes stop_codon:yes gene_type:complete